MRTQYTPDFEMFWKLYPQRWHEKYGLIKRKKEPAFESWQKLTNEVKAECLMIAKKIKKSEGGSVRDCVTWINQKGWVDMRPDENKDKPTNVQIQKMAADLLKVPPEKKSEPVYKQRKRLFEQN